MPSRGMSLVEVVFSIVLVSGLGVVALNTVGQSTVVQGSIGDHARGKLLAAELLYEILAQPYSEPVDTPTVGLEALETLLARVGLDDTDDYNGLTEYPPKNKDGTAIPGYGGWSRTAHVDFVDPNNPMTVVATDQGVKRVKVVVKHNGTNVATAVALRTGTVPTTGSPDPVLVIQQSSQ